MKEQTDIRRIPPNLVVDAFEQVAQEAWDKSEPKPLLTDRLVDCIYHNFDRVTALSIISGTAVLGSITFRIIIEDADNSIPRLAMKAAVLGSSLAGGVCLGFMLGITSALILTGVSGKVGNLERSIRSRFFEDSLPGS